MRSLLRLPTKLYGLAAALTVAVLLTIMSASASASTNQITLLQDTSLTTAPDSAVPMARALGATTERMMMVWSTVAPNANAAKKPNFNASDPNAYPAGNWAVYDHAIEVAQQQGMTVDLMITGGSPRWASGADAPKGSGFAKDHSYYAWKPNANMYGQFVHAVTERYSGHFTPTGASTPLPAIHFWSFWNEPNFGQQLGPQAIKGSTVPLAPKMYRALLNAGWKALHQTQPGAQNITLIGEIAAKGYPIKLPGHPGKLPGNAAQTRALVFTRAVYCVDTSYRKLTGATARRFSCPTTVAAQRAFRKQNPALFSATGFAIHAYDSKNPPDTNPAKINSDYATFPVLMRAARALDRMTKAYGSGKHFPIYNDEYGIITSPPAPREKGNPQPAVAASQLNQAEYISFKNRRIAAYSQYLISDPVPSAQQTQGGFASGLFTSKGTPKATLAAFRLPVWLPQQTVRRGERIEIWGGARPAVFAGPAGRTVNIQIQKGGQGQFNTISTRMVGARTGYFDIRMTLPYGGTLRLSYTYPQSEPFLPLGVAGSTIFSRSVRVTIKG
jgi:hypothetical protein